MRNIWIICGREVRSYFVSPVAYVLLVMFALIFGWFYWNMLGAFVFYSMASQVRGEVMPMNPLDKLRKAATGENDRIAELKKKLTYSKAVQARFLPTWELNRAYYSGNQWVYLLEPYKNRAPGP